MLYVENDPEGQARATAFRQGLEKRGWTVGRDLQIDYHWGVGDGDWIRSAAAGLLTEAPDVILANGGAAARAVQQSTRAVPVVFIGGADPMADGLVQGLARPGGNLTGSRPWRRALARSSWSCSRTSHRASRASQS
jgi:putative ABC transport system substrate-binding protein